MFLILPKLIIQFNFFGSIRYSFNSNLNGTCNQFSMFLEFKQKRGFPGDRRR